MKKNTRKGFQNKTRLQNPETFTRKRTKQDKGHKTDLKPQRKTDLTKSNQFTKQQHKTKPYHKQHGNQRSNQHKQKLNKKKEINKTKRVHKQRWRRNKTTHELCKQCSENWKLTCPNHTNKHFQNKTKHVKISTLF